MLARLTKSYWQVLYAHSRLIVTGFCLIFFSVFGQTVFIGVYMPDLRERFDLSQGGIGTLYGIATLLSAAVLIYTGKGIDTIPLRRFVIYCLVGLVLGALLLVYSPVALLLVPAFFLLRQCGQALMPLTAHTAINRYIESGRGRAVSMINFGGPLHMLAMPVFAHWYNVQTGWEYAWLSYAGFMLLGLLPLFAWLLANHQRDRVEPWQARLRAEEKAIQETTTNNDVAPTPLHWQRMEVLKDWRFYIICAVLVIPGTFNTAIFFYQAEVGGHLGLEPLAYATTFPVMTAMMLIANVAGGYILDNYGEAPVVTAFPVIYALALLMLGLGHGYGAATAGMALIGIGDGLQSVTGGPLIARIYGTRHLGAIKSTLVAVMILGTSISTPITGGLLDFGLGAGTILLGFMAYAMLAWLCWLPLTRALPAHKA